MTQNADETQGIPSEGFVLLTDELLHGLWGFVDMMPESTQMALEKAVRGRVTKVTPKVDEVGYAEKDALEKLKGWGFRE